MDRDDDRDDLIANVIGFVITMAILFGLCYLATYFDKKNVERVQQLCRPGIVLHQQGNQVLCANGEKQWMVTVP